MSKPPPLHITPIALRQAKIVDGDKVRYRVYRTKTDYVAVIAESALMAMKVADIKNPYRIVRDLPTHENSIAGDRFVQEDAGAATRISLPTSIQPSAMATSKVELKKSDATPQMLFKPIRLGDLQQSKTAAPSTGASSHESSSELPQPIPTAPPLEVALLPVDMTNDAPLSPEQVEKLLNE